ncbi:MAG: hypothetical protein R3A10_04740 [Caldilineaceae bacterium]
MSGVIMVPQANVGAPTGSPWGWSGAHVWWPVWTTRCTGRPTRSRPAPSPTWTQPPAVPVDLLVLPEGDGLVAQRGRANSEADLAFYEIGYTTPSLTRPDGRWSAGCVYPPATPP